MSTKRLVVLDERDYKNLIDESKRCKTVQNQPEEKLPKEIDNPREPTPEPKAFEAPPPEFEEGHPIPTEVEPETTEGSPKEPEEKSELERLLQKVPKVAHQDALNLLERLSKLNSFDHESGQIVLEGKPVDNYSLERFLSTTCTKSANDDIPVPLRLFLRKHNIRKFRNKKIKLPPLKPWKNLHD